MRPDQGPCQHERDTHSRRWVTVATASMIQRCGRRGADVKRGRAPRLRHPPSRPARCGVIWRAERRTGTLKTWFLDARENSWVLPNQSGGRALPLPKSLPKPTTKFATNRYQVPI